MGAQFFPTLRRVSLSHDSPIRRVSLPNTSAEFTIFEDKDSDSFHFAVTSPPRRQRVSLPNTSAEFKVFEGRKFESLGRDEDNVHAVSKAFRSTKRANRRRVRFFSKVQVQPIDHFADMTRKQRDSIWFTESELQRSKKIQKKTVARMVSGRTIGENDPKYCTRGLEAKTPIGAAIRSILKFRAREAVLNEQELQREESFHDPSFIATASMDISLQCQKEAHQRGEYDARVTQSYLREVPGGNPPKLPKRDPEPSQKRKMSLKKKRKMIVGHDGVVKVLDTSKPAKSVGNACMTAPKSILRKAGQPRLYKKVSWADTVEVSPSNKKPTPAVAPKYSLDSIFGAANADDKPTDSISDEDESVDVSDLQDSEYWAKREAVYEAGMWAF